MKIGINQIKYLTKFCTPHQIKSNQILEKRFEHKIKGQRKENRQYLRHSEVKFKALPTPTSQHQLMADLNGDIKLSSNTVFGQRLGWTGGQVWGWAGSVCDRRCGK